MKRLLIFVDWYLPGYKAGGQISSCANIIYALQDKMDISVITRDRDQDDTAAYPGITADAWQQQQGIRINYVSPGKINAGNLATLIREAMPDTIYFNSMFSYHFTLLPLLVIKRIRSSAKLVLAPRGMLQAGALQFKTFKKKLVLGLLYYTGLIRNVIFHATDETEGTDINKNIKGHPRVQLVYDFPVMQQDAFTGISKQVGSLKCLFVSRIVRKKNLLYLLQLMQQTKMNISLTVAGPVEDKIYWEACLQQIQALPAGCHVNYTGPVPNNQLAAIYRDHHLFVLPTLGENFGHVIFDAFINGRPVLISDQTPWQKLSSQQAGFDISLTKKEGFLKALEYFAAMDTEELAIWCKGAWQFGNEHIRQVGNLKDQYQSLFS